MSDTDTVRHTAEDGSVYAVEVVPPERDDYGAQYGVELVRASTSLRTGTRTAAAPGRVCVVGVG